MGILDEAIREHLELKRQHGADDSELRQLEDEAFGPAERPGGAEPAVNDPASEAPTEFMVQPDLDEAEPAAPAEQAEAPSEPPPARREPAAGVTDIQEPPEPAAEEDEPAAEEDEPVAEEHPPEPVAEEPVEEEQPAAEHEVVPPPAGPTTEERHAIADQPTQMYDVEEEFAASDAPAPPDEDLVAEEINEGRLGPAERLPAEDEASDEDFEEDDFFDEKRLSDELDQALEGPVDREPEPVSDEHEVAHADEHEVAHADEHERAEEQVEEAPVAEEQRSKDEDVLDDTPDFLEGHPEDDQLWFEQKPPKDFDFDD